MKRDINDYIKLHWYKNGNVKITHDYNNEANIYILLRELGYRKTKLDSKRIYFRRIGADIIPVKIFDIKNAFLNVLQNEEFENISDEVRHNSIINWYYQQKPIKENGLFDHYLEDTLTEEEEHDFRLKTDHVYRNKFEVQQLLLKIDNWGFKKTVEIKGEISMQGTPLYYKNLDNIKYLIFSHHIFKGNDHDIFDCWVATFANEKHIGKTTPLGLQTIRLGFHLDRDFQLIKDYLN